MKKKSLFKIHKHIQIKQDDTSSKCLLEHSADTEITEGPLIKSCRHTIPKSSSLPSSMCPLMLEYMEWRNDTQETWREGSCLKDGSQEKSVPNKDSTGTSHRRE